MKAGPSSPQSDTLEGLCREAYRPLVAVASSSNAKTCIGRNHIDPATLFEAFVNLSIFLQKKTKIFFRKKTKILFFHFRPIFL